MRIIEQFNAELEKLGSIACFVSIEHLSAIQRELGLLVEENTQVKSAYQSYLADYYDFASLMENSKLKSICIVATKSPPQIIRFQFNEFHVDAVVPPIYLYRRQIVESIRMMAENVFGPPSYSTYPVVLPKKPLAVHSGLGKYGRNNLVYVAGMGSYHRLTAFATDIPVSKDWWYPLCQMDSCTSCRSCERHCPSQAIGEHSFAINSARCITAYNEHSGQFPAWLDQSWHNSLVGCMVCQSVCPINKGLFQKEVAFTLSPAETELIISGTPMSTLPNSLKAKLTELSLDLYYKELARNLQAVRHGK